MTNKRRSDTATKRRRGRGNAILEAALVLPILLLLAFGTIEFGYYFYVRHNLHGAAREGARAGIVPSASNQDVNAAVANAMATFGLQNSGYTVSLSPGDVSSAREGDPITVTVQCTWGSVGVRPLQLISASKIITASAVMRKEG